MVAPDIRGFNIIRKLGEGARAEVFIARVGGELLEPAASTVVLKLYRERVVQPDWFTEVEALERAAGTHVVELHDIAQTSAGRVVLVLERLETGSLTQLLRQRDQISVGEAITIAAPLIETLERLHAAGVSHGAISTDAVMFSKHGAPSLARFGAATLVDPGMPPARRAANEHLVRDVAAALTLVSAVLNRVGADRDVLSLRDWLSSNAEAGSPTLLPNLAARLFDLGEPQAVRPANDADRSPSSAPRGDLRAFESRARIIAAPVLVDTTGLVDSAGLVDAAVLTDGPAVNAQTTAAFVMPHWLRSQLARWFDANPSPTRVRATVLARVSPLIVGRLIQVRQSITAVRPRIWVFAAAVAVAVLIASVLTAHSDTPGPAEQLATSAAESVASDTAETPESTDAPESTDTSPAESTTINDSVASAIQSDDPRRALAALLSAREDCIRDLSVLCLDSVAQLGSSALAEDQGLIRAIQAGGELRSFWSIEVTDFTIVERLGDSVLISTGEKTGASPGSILVMKGPDGWRVRDYFPMT